MNEARATMIEMFRNIRRNIVEDGLITSSSGFLVNSMVNRIDFQRPLQILEIGSGKGAFTGELIRRMSEASSLDICEIKPEYNHWVQAMIAGSPQKSVRLHNCCMTELLKEPDRYDVILSSLPLRNFSSRNDNNAFLNSVIQAVKFGLKEGGTYLQYQYFRSNKSEIEAVFGKPMDAISFVPMNILPAFVYQMTK